MNDAIIQAKQIDEQSKAAEFYQEALDHLARQGYGNATFEVNAAEGLDLVEEFYIEGDLISEVKQSFDTDKSSQQANGFAVDIQKGLKQSVQTLN